ncbi:cupin domain-containing protein [Virgibacillus sp. CBA3643]|uniref:cupin domain-containing protein n=1 Tax=Virgibacillus sp. CBA3643 TaxID=2942278 RepID=UPI0035A26B89
MDKTILVDKESKGRMFVEKLKLRPDHSGVMDTENDLFYFVLSGYGLMNVEAYGYNLEQETGVFVPKDSRYTFKNTGEVDLVLVCYGVK